MASKGHVFRSAPQTQAISPAFQSLAGGLGTMTMSTKTLKVRMVVRSAVGLGLDVVNRGGLGIDPCPDAGLAQVVVPHQDDAAELVPLLAIPSLVPRLSRLVRHPARNAMRIAQAGTVSS